MTELNCKYNGNASIANLLPLSAAGKDSLALHVIKFVQITGSCKYNNNLSAEFEALMGIKILI